MTQDIVGRVDKAMRDLNEALYDASRSGLVMKVTARAYHQLIPGLTLVEAQVMQPLEPTRGRKPERNGAARSSGSWIYVLTLTRRITSGTFRGLHIRHSPAGAPPTRGLP